MNPTETPEGIDTKDPRWIGAWWLGAVIISLPLILIGPVLTLFPEKIPNNSGKKCDADEVAKELESPFTFTEWKRESLAFAKRVAKNKIYLFNLGSHMFKVKSHIFK